MILNFDICLATYSVNKATERTGTIMNDLITDRTPPEGGQGPASLWGMGQVAGGVVQLFPENGRKTDAHLRGLRDPTAHILDAGAQAQALPNLNYTQAFILLGVPEEERAQFMAEIDGD